MCLVVLEDVLEALADLAEDEAVDVVLLDIFVRDGFLVLILFCFVGIFRLLFTGTALQLVCLALFVEPFECNDELLREAQVVTL